MTVLVIAEHDTHHVKPSTYSTIDAALQFGSPVHALIVGKRCVEAAEDLSEAAGLIKILQVMTEDEHALAENIAQIIKQLAKDYTHILAPSTTFGKNILPRAAGLLEVGMISDITAIVDHETFVRPIYAGNAYATVKSFDPIKLLTVRPTCFEHAQKGEKKATIEQVNCNIESLGVKFISLQTPETTRPALDAARVVISGGRGLQSKDNFKLIEQLADKLSAAVGASRAAVDAGFVPNDCQVGQTGKVVAPDLYIAIGISGAVQHLAGMKDSKIIVAINKDEDAPIFQVADYGLVGDLFKILPELIQAL